MVNVSSFHCSACLEMRLAHSCLLKFSVHVNIISCGAKSLYLQRYCFGGEPQPWWMRCLQKCSQRGCTVLHSLVVAFLDKVAKVLRCVFCSWYIGQLWIFTQSISDCSMVWNKRTGWRGKNHVRSVSQSPTPAVPPKSLTGGHWDDQYWWAFAGVFLCSVPWWANYVSLWLAANQKFDIRICFELPILLSLCCIVYIERVLN